MFNRFLSRTHPRTHVRLHIPRCRCVDPVLETCNPLVHESRDHSRRNFAKVILLGPFELASTNAKNTKNKKLAPPLAPARVRGNAGLEANQTRGSEIQFFLGRRPTCRHTWACASRCWHRLTCARCGAHRIEPWLLSFGATPTECSRRLHRTVQL